MMSPTDNQLEVVAGFILEAAEQFKISGEVPPLSVRRILEEPPDEGSDFEEAVIEAGFNVSARDVDRLVKIIDLYV